MKRIAKKTIFINEKPYILTKHAQERMLRHGVLEEDVIRIIEAGNIERVSRHKSRYRGEYHPFQKQSWSLILIVVVVTRRARLIRTVHPE